MRRLRQDETQRLWYDDATGEFELRPVIPSDAAEKIKRAKEILCEVEAALDEGQEASADLCRRLVRFRDTLRALCGDGQIEALHQRAQEDERDDMSYPDTRLKIGWTVSRYMGLYRAAVSVLAVTDKPQEARRRAAGVPDDRRCLTCGEAIDRDAHARQRYCSTKCRVAAHRKRSAVTT